MRAVLDRLDVTADAFADLVFLGRHPLAVGQQRLVLAEVDIDIRALEAPDGAADDVADAVLELVENHRLLGPANLLHERLLGVLRGDASEIGRCDFHLDLIAQLRVGFDASGVEDGDLVVLGKHLLRDDQFGQRLDVSTLAVNGYAQFPGRADRLLGSGHQRFLHSRDEDILGDALFALPKVENCQKV